MDGVELLERDDRPVAPVRRPDLTTGPIALTLLWFALPTLGSNILQSLNASINAIWVGRFLGERALAATSNVNLVMFLMFASVFGFGMASSILIGQSVGRRDADTARRVLGTAIGLFLVISTVIAAAGWVLAPTLLDILATPPDALPLALSYLRVIFLALPAIFVLVLLSISLNAHGDSLTPLWFMVLCVVLDSGLNPLLIRGIGPIPALGIAGSATATLIANDVSVVALIGWIYARDLPIRLRGAELRYLLPNPALLRTIFGRGLPMGLQMLVMSASALSLIGLVNREGVIVTAAYGVTQQLWTYVQMPAIAIGGAVSSMAAQNIGAGKWHRLTRITLSGMAISVSITASVVILLLAFDRTLLALFITLASPAIPIAQHINLIGGWGFALMGITMVLFGTVRANGSVVGPLAVLFSSLFAARLSFAWGLYPWLHADAIWWSFPVGSVTSTILAAVHYRLGGWRRIKLLRRDSSQPTQANGEACGQLSPSVAAE